MANPKFKMMDLQKFRIFYLNRCSLTLQNEVFAQVHLKTPGEARKTMFLRSGIAGGAVAIIAALFLQIP